jgi:hypothetical protein
MTKFSTLALSVASAILLTAYAVSSPSAKSSTNSTTALQGVLDSTFGTNGLITHHNAAGGNGDDGGGGIVRDGSGNLYISGESFNGTNADMVIWKIK